MKKETVSLFFFIFAIILIGAMLPSRFAVTTSPSLENRIFFVLERFPVQNIKVGEYVMLDITAINASPKILAEIERTIEQEKTTRIIKRVSCGAGDILETSGSEYFCNGVFIGRAKDKTRTGKPTEKFKYHAHIPPGFLFVTGDHVDSLDSKYFGLVHESKIQCVLASIL